MPFKLTDVFSKDFKIVSANINAESIKMLNFIKMNGLGNDFVVIDSRGKDVSFSSKQIQKMSCRYTGIGFDQLIILRKPDNQNADIFMFIFNADGGEVAACGNASRCVADLLMKENGKANVTIETVAGIVSAKRTEKNMVSVDMGTPKTKWQEIPLAENVDTLHIPISYKSYSDPVGVSVGNPHAVFFVDDVEAVDVETIGAEFEQHKIFPERANIEFVQVLDKNNIRMRVWERGTGITKACGTGSCASAIASIRRNLTNRKVKVYLDGGVLEVEWIKNGNVILTGATAINFNGTIDESLFK